MKPSSKITLVALALMIAAFAGSVMALHGVEDIRGQQATLQEVLFVPSGKVMKRMSLGYSGIVADIYWTRAVQYFGAKHLDHAERYDLLSPLLDITTDLDPHLLIAYEYGAIFLSQPPPAGAGLPDKAVALLEKGIQANPKEWKLYFSLGFVHYMNRKDYKAAELAFRRGSEVPNAHPWMRVMAATMAEHAHDASTAYSIWKFLYDTTQDKMLRDNARQHLQALQSDDIVAQLEQRIAAFREKTGHLPASWQEMVRDGWLSRIPYDPTRNPYQLMEDGRVLVEDPDSLPFITRGVPPGWKKSEKSH